MRRVPVRAFDRMDHACIGAYTLLQCGPRATPWGKGTAPPIRTAAAIPPDRKGYSGEITILPCG